jgi:hypothetical protein
MRRGEQRSSREALRGARQQRRSGHGTHTHTWTQTAARARANECQYERKCVLPRVWYLTKRQE